MAYEKTIETGRGSIRVKVLREGIEIESLIRYPLENQQVTIQLVPEVAEKLQEALDTALCYFGEKKTP